MGRREVSHAPWGGATRGAWVGAVLLAAACATTNDPSDPARVVGVDYELRSHPMGIDRTQKATPPSGEPPKDVDWRPGAYMAQALGRVLDGALHLQGEHEHLGFYAEGACVLGAYIDAGKSNDMTLSVTPGQEYVAMAAGDLDATDINLRVEAEDGQLVGEDVADDAMPLVRFVPRGDRVRVVMHMAHLEGSGSFGALTLLKAGGVRLSRERVDHAIQMSLAVAGSASGRVGAHVPGAQGLVFQAAGEWGFYAVLLEPRTWWRTSGVDLHHASVILGGGDGIARELAIDVRDGDAVVGTAADKDDRPLVLLRDAPKGPVSVTLSNNASPQVSLATLLVLSTE